MSLFLGAAMARAPTAPRPKLRRAAAATMMEKKKENLPNMTKFMKY